MVKRRLANEVKIYNLDAIIAVGYRVNSKKATEFRTRATKWKNYMDIRTKFIKDFPIPKGNKSNPYIILFDGYTGMGKSTVAKVIAKKDNSVILNNDQVRDWLNDYHDSTNLKSDLQKYRLELLLKNNNSCIFDSCFCHNWKEKIKYYNKLGYKYYIIRLECSELIVKERLSSRVKDDTNYSIANFNDYLWMKENVPRVDDNLVDYTINTETNIEEQVDDFINQYNLK